MKTLTIYWPAFLALVTVLLSSAIDPALADQLFPFSFAPGRLVDMLASAPFLVCLVPAVAGLVYASRVWSAAPEGAHSTTDKMLAVWFLMNAAWFHIGCDVFSGLFQIMPNMTEGYALMNAAHDQPMHHPARMGLDVVYWFELFVQMPLCYLTFFLYLRRSAARPVVEGVICGLHAAGTVAYYLPNLIHYESTHPLLSQLDRGFGFLWILIPALIVVRGARQLVAERESVPATAPVAAPAPLPETASA